MDSKTSSTSVSGPQQASNQDEIFMQQSLLFSDTLTDLKSIRKQLYSAAEYFETSNSKQDQKQIVVEILKDYAMKALINSVDHLGSVAYKVNSFIDEKIREVSALELRFRCLQQRARTCQEYINRGGLSQQFLMVQNPKYHKHQIFPAEETSNTKSRYHRRSFSAEYNSNQFRNAARTTIKGTSPSIFREGHYRSESPQFYSKQGTFTFTDKRAASPQQFPFTRSGSLFPKRQISPNSPFSLRKNPSETQRSVSLSKYGERRGANDVEQYSSKSKRFFKALLSMHKSRKDQTLYKYLDEV